MSGHLTPTWGNRCHNKGRRAISCDWGKICGHAKLCCILFRVHISHISSQSLIADVADKCNKCKYENVTQVPESILSGFTTDQNPLPYIQRAAAIPSGLEKKKVSEPLEWPTTCAVLESGKARNAFYHVWFRIETLHYHPQLRLCTGSECGVGCESTKGNWLGGNL